jgi:NAD(P)-dependent dehydrogenase (short-subunit alcohol dehydrogenase family)
MKNINETVVLLTGASSGIGKATAKQLLEKGYIVYGAARRVEKMADLKEMGAHVLAMDVTDDASMVNGVGHIAKENGGVSVLINSAGYGSYGAIEDVDMAEARRQFEVSFALIAKEGGFTRSNLYKYFPSKEEVVLEFLKHDLILWRKHLVKTCRRRKTRSVETFASVWVEILSKHQRLLDLLSILHSFLEKNVSEQTLVVFKRRATDHGPRGGRGDDQWKARLRPLGANLLRRVRRSSPEEGTGQVHSGVIVNGCNAPNRSELSKNPPNLSIIQAKGLV